LERDQLAAESLGKIGPKAVVALPSLHAAASDQTNLWTLRTFVGAMNRIEPGSASFAFEKVVNQITSTNERIRAITVEVLGEVGPAARASLPQIRALQNDEWKMVRDAVAEALPKIDRPQ
jgi:HEAT repeat protein